MCAYTSLYKVGQIGLTARNAAPVPVSARTGPRSGSRAGRRSRADDRPPAGRAPESHPRLLGVGKRSAAPRAIGLLRRPPWPSPQPPPSDPGSEGGGGTAGAAEERREEQHSEDARQVDQSNHVDSAGLSLPGHRRSLPPARPGATA